MEKCHAIIAFFTVGRSLDRDECCVINFSDRCSAKSAFKVKLAECGNDGVLANQDGEEMDADALYDYLESTGTYFDAADATRFFIRGEKVYADFGEETREETSWESESL